MRPCEDLTSVAAGCHHRHHRRHRPRHHAGYQGADKRPGNRGLDVDWQVAMRPGQRRKLEPESPEAVSEKRTSVGQS